MKKCAWCKTIIIPRQYQKVEHYRFCCRKCRANYGSIQGYILAWIHEEKAKTECLKILEQNGVNSIFPFSVLNREIEGLKIA